MQDATIALGAGQVGEHGGRDGTGAAGVVLNVAADADDAELWAERVRAAYDELRAPLWRAIVAWSGSNDVADEAVAESFAQLLRRGAEVRDPAAWAWRSAFRIAAGDLKRRRLATGPGSDGLRTVAGRPDRLPDDAIDLVRALAQLSDQQRRCVALVDVAGHTAPSAAAVLGTSAATVRVQLMRARRHLRTLLADPAEEIR
ncbi:MAG: putative polymerase subfamily sigma factor [Acidimicrobiales bacterium]|nr:putative polymerase subfamily sigma factor [Acidimicrobiales bacterium]